MVPKKIKNRLIDLLSAQNPYKVIIFGSFATGSSQRNSDIDLYIVTSDEFIPRDFKQNMELKTKYSKLLDPLREHYPLDLIVHTLPMYKKFTDINSMFCREIMKNGVVVYETKH